MSSSSLPPIASECPAASTHDFQRDYLRRESRNLIAARVIIAEFAKEQPANSCSEGALYFS